jgi:diguanylate cyclase (GGDEF)-like protein
VVFGDLDGFKGLNDRFGHRRGDELLRSVAQALQDEFERSGAILGRVGGDEFVVAQRVGHGSDAADLLVACRRSLLRVGLRHDGIDVSLGLAESCAGDTAIELLHRADLAMYQEKRRRKLEPVAHETLAVMPR